MERPQSTNYKISDLLEWYEQKRLVLQPKFQRRPVWSDKARSYLIDTILRNYPIPKLFIRERIDLMTRQAIREVVDGQQRLRSIIDYVNGKFSILKAHNKTYGGMLFEELPDNMKKDFLSYSFAVDILVGDADVDVLDVFSRINSYTITLNAQEKLNANYFGPFKQIIYELGYEHLNFWLNNGILTNLKIARMAEAELTSELIVAMLDGLQQGKESIKSFYKQYDEEFPFAEKVKKEFRNTIDSIGFVFENKLPESTFNRVPLFYSLFCVFYDAQYGLPNSDRTRLKFNEKNRHVVSSAFKELGLQLRKREPERKFAEFVAASTKGTANLKSRTIRHEYIWDAILLKLNG